MHNYFVFNEELRSTCDFNGESANQSGFVYEVVRVVEGIPLFLEDHIQRLKNSAEAATITLPVSEKFMKQSFKALIVNNKVTEGNIKCVAGNRTTNKLFYAAWFQPHFYPAVELYKQGVVVGMLNEERKNPNAKVWRADFQQRIQQQKLEQQVFELLLISNGRLTEGTKSNVFLIKKAGIYTAPSDQVLGGITRSKVLEMAESIGMEIFEQNLAVADLMEAEAVFLTGTSPKILPVAAIAGFSKNFIIDHPVLQQLIAMYDSLIEAYIKAHQ
ncbi:MAG TPA: aminotransferase class IV [Bacteroidales bacterium]|nr:aminotransferase class IV [Bacteroidales bacterium]